MKILVLGAGQVGRQICRYLEREDDCNVAVLDSNSEFVANITDLLGITGVVGQATNPSDLRKAGIEETDLVVATTSSDEANLIACFMANKLNEQARTIARIRNPNYKNMISRIHGGFVDVVINPEEEVSSAVFRLLRSRHIFYHRNLLDDRVHLVGLKIGETINILNTSLRQLTDMFVNLRTVVIALRRGGHLRMSDSDDEMRSGDEVYAIVASEDLDRTLEIFGIEQSHHERIIIVGAGNVGIGIAKGLEEDVNSTLAKIIELDMANAEVAAESLARTIVFHGDGLSLDILEEVNIANAHAIVAVTQDDKTNLLTLTQAKKLNPRLMTVGLVNDPTLAALKSSLGIDIIINPQTTTVSSILPQVKAGNVSKVHIVGDDEAEAFEVEVSEDSRLKGKTIRNAKLPAGVLVGAMQKGKDIVSVFPDTRIDAGDRLVLFMLAEDVRSTSRYLSSDAFSL